MVERGGGGSQPLRFGWITQDAVPSRARSRSTLLVVPLELREIVDDLLRLADRQVFRDRLMLGEKILIRQIDGFLID
jgi:hypothetical protein